MTLCYSLTVRLGRPGGSGGPRWPRSSQSWVVREDSELCYLHPSVIPIGPVVPGLSPVTSQTKTSRKTQVLPGCSRCPPGILPVFPDELGPPRYGAGVFQKDPGCRCITEPTRAHRDRRSVLFTFLGHGVYFYISISIHIKSNLSAQQLTLCGKIACIYM